MCGSQQRKKHELIQIVQPKQLYISDIHSSVVGMWGGGLGHPGVGQQGEGREEGAFSLMAPPSASLLTSFFSPQKSTITSTTGPGWSMSPATPTWTSSSGWSSSPSSMASASAASSSIPEEFLSPPPQTFGSQLYGGGSRPQTDVKHLSTFSLRQEMRK